MKGRLFRMVVISLFSLSGLTMAFNAGADSGNYIDYIVGARAAGMGGVAVACARSVDACYYNPAGLAHVTSNTISHNLLLRNFNKPRIKRIGRIVFSFNQHNPRNPRLNKLPKRSEG